MLKNLSYTKKESTNGVMLLFMKAGKGKKNTKYTKVGVYFLIAYPSLFLTRWPPNVRLYMCWQEKLDYLEVTSMEAYLF